MSFLDHIRNNMSSDCLENCILMHLNGSNDRLVVVYVHPYTVKYTCMLEGRKSLDKAGSLYVICLLQLCVYVQGVIIQLSLVVRPSPPPQRAWGRG